MGKDIKGKELGKGIAQRKDGLYYGRYTDVYGVRKAIYDKDLRSLKKRLKEAMYETDQGIAVMDTSIKLKTWFEKWINIYKEGVIRENTKRAYVDLFRKHIEPYLGNFKLVDISQIHCKELMNKLESQEATQRKLRIVMTDLFNCAMDNQLLKRNPMKGVRFANNKINERKVLTLDEQAMFFECCSGTFYDNLFIVAVNTGLRAGEIAALTWGDIDLDKREISVTKTLVYSKYLGDKQKKFHLEPPKTKSSIRCVPINSECEKALKKQFVQKQITEKRRGVRHNEFSDRLFINKYNSPLSSYVISKNISSIIREINTTKDDLEQIEKFSGHTFRHTFATRCIESGVSPKVLQAYLGHASLSMTMDLYVHATDEFKHDEMDKLVKTYNSIKISNEAIEQSYNDAQKMYSEPLV